MGNEQNKKHKQLFNKIQCELDNAGFFYLEHPLDMNNNNGEYIQIGLKRCPFVWTEDYHFEVRIEKDSIIYVMFHLEQKNFTGKETEKITNLLNSCGLNKSDLDRCKNDNWLWYYKDSSGIQITGKKDEEIVQEVIYQLKELDKAIKECVYVSLSLL